MHHFPELKGETKSDSIKPAHSFSEQSRIPNRFHQVCVAGGPAMYSPTFATLAVSACGDSFWQHESPYLSRTESVTQLVRFSQAVTCSNG